MKRPLVGLTLIFCFGVFVAGSIDIDFRASCLLALLLLFLGILSVRRNKSFEIILSCLVFFLGAAAFKNAKILPQCEVSRFVSYKDNTPQIVEGFIDSQPSVKNNKLSFIFKPRKIHFENLQISCCGKVLVYTSAKKELGYAQEVVLSGNLYRPHQGRKNNGANYSRYLSSQGIYSIMNAKVIFPVSGGDKNTALIFKKAAFRLREQAEAAIFKNLSPASAGILDAMILGEKKNVPPLVYNAMIKAGTVHILVVSGFNVGIVAFIILMLLKLARVPRAPRFYIAVILLLEYCFMTGASNPVIRATIMALVFMFSYFVKRDADIYTSCALAAISILLFNPRQLFDAGFQLSFASVLSIVYLYPRIKSVLRLGHLENKYLRFFIDGFLVSFSAWLGTAGFVFSYFRIFSPIAPFANIIIVPLASLITLSGFSLMGASLFFPPLVKFFASACELWSLLLVKINFFLIQIPGACFHLS